MGVSEHMTASAGELSILSPCWTAPRVATRSACRQTLRCRPRPASRSGRAPGSPSANAARLPSTSFDPTGRSTSLTPSGSSRLSARRRHASNALRHEVPSSATTASPLVARWPAALCAKTKPIHRMRPVRGPAMGFSEHMTALAGEPAIVSPRDNSRPLARSMAGGIMCEDKTRSPNAAGSRARPWVFRST